MNDPIFTADHHGFYRNGEPFFPLIQDNTVLLRLPAQLNDTLDWSTQIEQAHQIISSNKSLLWEIDLGLPDFQFTPDNSAAFFSFSLALEEFTSKVWPLFANHTFGAALYRGGLPNFPLSHWETAFVDSSYSCYTLYSIQMLSEYLHRLISFLPDTILPFAFIDATTIASPAKAAQLFSKARFEHLHLALKGAKSPFPGLCWETGQPFLASSPPIAIYLPDDALIDPAFLQKLDNLLPHLTDFRWIPEEKLTEQWDGLDLLLVDPDKISLQGKRKLLGFIAAGGAVESFERTPILI